jgi:NADH-quinone oxidoreductase subunit L
MAIALVVGLAGIGLAWWLYRRGPSAKVDSLVAGGGATVHRVVANKLYVDEIYDRLIVRPFGWLSRAIFEVIDRVVIDLLLVNGSAWLVNFFGRIARWFQNGQVQRYLVALLIGTAVIFYLASRSPADFGYAKVGGTAVAFKAVVGAGPSAAGAVIEWDFDGDGKVDPVEDPRAPSFTYPQAGTYRVTMWLKDGVFGKTERVSHEIEVGGGL